MASRTRPTAPGHERRGPTVPAAARAANLPIFYCTQETRPNNRPAGATSTKRRGRAPDPDGYTIYHEFTPQASDIVIWKQRASAFQGTPLFSHLSLLGVQSLIVCGESTSGCVRAATVDGCTRRYRMMVVEECVFDRHQATHALNLFDINQKYGDVIPLGDALAYLAGRQSPQATERELALA